MTSDLTLARLALLQEKLAPVEGSNIPGRLRYLKLKSKGLIPKRTEDVAAQEGPQVPFGGNLVKESGIAGDLRRSGLGGIKRPPFPTTDSVKPQQLNMKRQQNVARFKERTTDKMLRPQGPSISQTASTTGTGLGRIRTKAMSPYMRE